jgi:hypothetical protein
VAIEQSLRDAVTGLLVDAARGTAAFIGVFQQASPPIPITLQSVDIKLSLTWSITATTKFSENASASGSFWQVASFSAQENFGMSSQQLS